MTMPRVPGRGTLVTKLPPGDPLPWCRKAVWGEASAWQSKDGIAIKSDLGGLFLTKPRDKNKPVEVGRRFVMVESWFTDDSIGHSDFINIEFHAKQIEGAFYIAIAEEWLTNNFPQDTITLDGKEYIILTEDDMAIAIIANPNARDGLATNYGGQSQHFDGSAFYCPYVPLTFSGQSLAPVKFQTRYGLQE